MFKNVTFNTTKFSFEKKETKAIFFHAALLTKMDRRFRMTKCKVNFCKLTQKVRKYGFD